MPFGTDMLEEAFPLRNFAVEELKAGRPFPVWNPFAYSGIPFLETLPYPVFYPTSLLYFVISLGRAIGWSFVIHFCAAGIFMFALARRLGISRWGAALAGLAFMFNGYLVSHLYAGQDGRMFAMTLIPLVFYFLRVGLDTGRLAPFLLMGGAVALQIFTPHVQIMYFSSLAAVAYFLSEAAGIWRRSGPRPALAAASRFTAGYALAALVAAVQLWPTFTFLRWAVRGAEAGYVYASSWALPPGELSALIAPDLFGSLHTYWGPNFFKLHTEYMGAVPLVLALAAVLWAGRRRTLFWALLLLGSLLFALGAATPVHRLAYAFVPMIKSFRAPSMMIAVAAFAVATLAGFGFDALAGLRRRREVPGWREGRSLVFLGVAALLVLAWILGAAAPQTLASLVGGGEAELGGQRAAARAEALRAFPASFGIGVFAWLIAAGVLWWGLGRGAVAPPLAAAVLAGLLVLDLWRVDARYLGVVEIEREFAPGPADAFLARQEPPFRILALHGAMGPNEPILRRLEAVWGLQKFRLAWYDTLLGGSEAANLQRLPLWRVLNVRYVISQLPLDLPDLSRAFEGEPAVYRWEGEAPRAWIAAESRVTSDGEALRLLSDPAFEAHRVVLLAEPVEPPPPASAVPARDRAVESPAEGALDANPAREAAPPPRAGVRYLEYAPNWLEAEVTAAAPSFAVFSEAYHPYWEATVDGRPAEVARADLALRAVAVPAGSHRVRMEYRPRAFERARIVSLGALAAVFAYAAAGTWKRRRRRKGSA